MDSTKARGKLDAGSRGTLGKPSHGKLMNVPSHKLVLGDLSHGKLLGEASHGTLTTAGSRSAQSGLISSVLSKLEFSQDGLITEDKQLSAMGVACVLEEFLDEWETLRLINKLPLVITDLTFVPIEQRMQAIGRDQCQIDPNSLEAEKDLALERHRFQKRSAIIRQIMEETHQELQVSQSFVSLVNRVNEIRRKRAEEAHVFVLNKKYKEKIETLKRTISDERTQRHRDINKATNEIGRLNDRIQDLIYENKLKETYVNHWEKARADQAQHNNRQNENHYEHKIENVEGDCDRETRVSDEIKRYWMIKNQETNDQLDYWTEKYNKDAKELDTERDKLSIHIAEQKTELEKKTLLYETRKYKIAMYLEHKEKLRQQAELLAIQSKAAVRIQAWWRGVMVRRCLGPFSKKRKGKKGNKNQKKK